MKEVKDVLKIFNNINHNDYKDDVLKELERIRSVAQYYKKLSSLYDDEFRKLKRSPILRNKVVNCLCNVSHNKELVYKKLFK